MKAQVGWKCSEPPYVVNTVTPCKGTFKVSLQCAICPFSVDSDELTEVEDHAEPDPSSSLQYDQEG